MIKGKEARIAGNITLTEVMEATGGNAPRIKGYVVTEGLTVGKDKWYTKAAIEAAAKEGAFNGVPMFINHSTDQEDYQRPERDLRDMVGKLTSTSVASVNGKTALAFEGVLHGSPTYSADALRTWLKDMLSAGVTPETSQHSWIEGVSSEMEGYPVFVVEHIAKAESLDFVTRGNAGGVIEAAESVKSDEERKHKKTTEGGKAMTLKEILEALKADAELRAALKEAFAPEFAAAAKESTAIKEAVAAKEAAEKAKEAAEAKVEAMELEKHKSDIVTAAKEKVTAAKLAEPVSKRVMESVETLSITKESKKEEVLANVESVIAKEKKYIDDLSKVQVFGNGDAVETEEGDKETMSAEEAAKKAEEILGNVGKTKEAK